MTKSLAQPFHSRRALLLVIGLHVLVAWWAGHAIRKQVPAPLDSIEIELLPMAPEAPTRAEAPQLPDAARPMPVSAVRPQMPAVPSPPLEHLQIRSEPLPMPPAPDVAAPLPPPPPLAEARIAEPPPPPAPPHEPIAVHAAERVPAPPAPALAQELDRQPSPVESVPAPQAPPDVQVSAPLYTADYLHNPKPDYPALSRRLGEEGVVTLRVYVTEEGTAHEVQIKSSCGFLRLDRAAQDAVKRWRFLPARRGDTSVAAWVLVPIRFSLKA